MKIESNNIVLTKNAKTINKNINKQGNNIVTNYKPITSLNTNELGIYKTLLRKNNLSFGVKRLNILAPNLNFDELLIYGMKYNVLLSKETLEDLRKQFIKRNKIITDYCLKFVSGEKLEDLDSDEKCENYINSKNDEDFDIEDNTNVLEICENKLFEQVDSIYEILKETLPATSSEINDEIAKLSKDERKLNNIVKTTNTAKRTSKQARFIEKGKSIRYTVIGELIRNDKYNKSGNAQYEIGWGRVNLFKICSYAAFSSMNDKDFIENICKKTNDITLPEPPKQLVNILKGSEMVFSNFDMQQELEENYIVPQIKINNLEIFCKLKIRLLKKHLEEIKKIEDIKSKEPIELDFDLFKAEEINAQKSVSTKKKNNKKAKESKKDSSLNQTNKIEINSQETIKQQLEIKQKKQEEFSTNLNIENMIDDIEINGEFQLVGLTLDNILKDLDSKKVFSKCDKYDDNHERYFANKEVVSMFFENLLTDEALDESLKKYIKFNKKEISEAQQHFIGSVLSRLRLRDPNLKLKEAIRIIAETLNEGVLVHSSTKNYNAKLDIYSPKHCLMIPFEIDDKNQTINLKTLLDFQDENARKTRYISNPRIQKLSSHNQLNTFHNNVFNKKNIPTYSLKVMSQYDFNLLKSLYQRQY